MFSVGAKEELFKIPVHAQGGCWRLLGDFTILCTLFWSLGHSASAARCREHAHLIQGDFYAEPALKGF